MVEIKEIEKKVLVLRDQNGPKTIARIIYYNGKKVITILDFSIHPVDRNILKSGKFSSRIKGILGSITSADRFEVEDVTQNYIGRFDDGELY